MSIKVITASACDISREMAADCGLTIVPLKVRFGDEEYLDNVNITHAEFFERLTNEQLLPTTSQINAYEYEEVFEKALGEYDEVICVTLSSKLSGTYQSAVMAAEQFEGRVSVVDSLNVCIGQRILVLSALDYVKKGYPRQEIVEKLEEDRRDIRLIAMLDTLEYLKKGGRISPTIAFAGALLSIKPVISIENGEVALKGKARGSKNAKNLLTQFVAESGSIDFEREFCLAYSGLDDTLLQTYIADSAYLYEGKADHLPVSQIGPIIGTHVGPGAIALAYFAQK